MLSKAKFMKCFNQLSDRISAFRGEQRPGPVEAVFETHFSLKLNDSQAELQLFYD